MDVAFNVNPLGMEGLGATLVSLIRNCSNSSQLALWFLCSDLKEKDKANICKLLQSESFLGDAEFIDFNAKEKFGHLKSLHGDWTTYGRLLIPELIGSDRVLYLDADLIIQTDVLEINQFTSDRILSAVHGSSVSHTFDKAFFIEKLKWSPDTAYFNAGVLWFNNVAWRANGTDKKVQEIADQYPQAFLSADQTLLNALSKGDFNYLPNKFNLPWHAGKPQPENTEDAIIHFVGSPKPWDVLGRSVHTGYALWKQYTPEFWRKVYGQITVDKLNRTWKIRGSINRSLKLKLTNK